jgi:hypothetical protein
LTDIRESTLVTFFKVLRAWGLRKGRDYTYNASHMYFQFANGSREVFKGLGWEPSDPDYQRLGSAEFTDFWLEEAGDGVPHKGYDVAMSRVRWMLKEHGLTQKGLITGNPGFYWCRDYFVMDREGRPVELPESKAYIQAFVDDNPDKGFVDLYKGNLRNMESDYDRARLLHGDWNAVERSGAEMYPAYEGRKHVADLEADPEAPLHLSFDFNRAPHMTLIIAQLEGPAVYIVDEVCPAPPNTNTPYTTKEFCRRWEKHQNKTVYLYGDSTGANPGTVSEDSAGNFAAAAQVLRANGWRVHNRVLQEIPSPAKRCEWVNSILAGRQGEMSITVHQSCTELQQDLLCVKKGPDGKKNKKRVADAGLGITYEPHGHETDALEYLLCSAYHADWYRYKNAGKYTQVHAPAYKQKAF